MQAVQKFLSCDWGTSSFRLRLVETAGFRVLAEKRSDQGNTNIFESWIKCGLPEEKRFEFYLSVLRDNLKEIEQAIGLSLDGLPLIISGMASSTIGMVELPYKDLPFRTDGSDLNYKFFERGPDFPSDILIISGVKTDNDVMRGEETQLVGSLNEYETSRIWFIHPGTHSKHVKIVGDQAVAFKTYMTGELFSLLSNESILSASVKKADDFHRPEYLKSFREGARRGIEGCLLHQLFMVRTNDLFQRLTPEQNYYYLSGLLLASELNQFPGDFNGELIIAGEDVLNRLYLEALKILGIDRQLNKLQIKNADEVTTKGQYQIYINRLH